MTWHRGHLTTEHAASSHGLPVVVAEDGTALGTAEIPGSLHVDGDRVVAADLLDAARRAGYAIESAIYDR